MGTCDGANTWALSGHLNKNCPDLLRKIAEVWCRRGDSNPHELPHTPLKRARLPVPPLRQKGEKFSKVAAIISRNLPTTERYLVFAGEAAGDAAGDVPEAAGDAAGADNGTDAGAAGDAAGDGLGLATGAGVDSSTEREPVMIGRLSVNAISMNAAAAPMVIFARRLAVPRGPKAVLDRLLEKSAPASALPGCSRITIINTKQDRMKSP